MMSLNLVKNVLGTKCGKWWVFASQGNYNGRFPSKNWEGHANKGCLYVSGVEFGRPTLQE